MADPIRKPLPPQHALPLCAAFIDAWNHKDTRRTTIERLARLLDEAQADIDADDCLRVRRREPAPGAAAHDRYVDAKYGTADDGGGEAIRIGKHESGAHRQKGEQPSGNDATGDAPAALPIDADKAQVAREALRALRRRPVG